MDIERLPTWSNALAEIIAAVSQEDVSLRVWMRSALAVDAAPSSAVGQHDSVRVVAFAERAAAPSAAFARRLCFSFQPVDVPFPAVAVLSGVPDFASRPASLAAVGISCRLLHCPYWAA